MSAGIGMQPIYTLRYDTSSYEHCCCCGHVVVGGYLRPVQPDSSVAHIILHSRQDGHAHRAHQRYAYVLCTSMWQGERRQSHGLSIAAIIALTSISCTLRTTPVVGLIISLTRLPFPPPPPRPQPPLSSLLPYSYIRCVASLNCIPPESFAS